MTGTPAVGRGPGAGITVQAVSLVESGILVNGTTVTDLLSGFTVRSDDLGDRTGGGGAGPGGAGTGAPVWCGSGVPLARLEAVRELVAEVAADRDGDPELTSANPLVPRVLFPWGVGEPRSDVLVTGPDARVTAAYLRSVGLRARCVDRDAAVRIAADLEMARAELAELTEPAEPGEHPGAVGPWSGRYGGESRDDSGDDRDDTGWAGGAAGTDGAADDLPGDTSTGARTPRPRFPVPAVVAAVALLVAGVLALVAVTGRGADPGSAVAAAVSGDAGGTGEAAETAEAGDSGAPGAAPGSSGAAVTEPDSPGWRAPVRKGDTGTDLPAARAAVPVTAELDGWTLREATARREIWMSDDPDARILVAATPTPLGTQEQLDARMLTVLETAPELTVLSRAPVDYEETSPASTTRWQVRLIDGHQVSVGCQYRGGTGDDTARRLATCDRFTATARVGQG